jgi:hypothetical protein
VSKSDTLSKHKKMSRDELTMASVAYVVYLVLGTCALSTNEKFLDVVTTIENPE